jgi:hypothetical protein
MKMKAYASFDQYLAGQAPRNRDVIRALRKFVKRVAPQLQESVKWGNGCWVQGKVPVAYVYSAPDHVQFGFFGGSALKDPSGLLKGEGKFVRHIKVRKRSDSGEKKFGTLLRQAATRNRLVNGPEPRPVTLRAEPSMSRLPLLEATISCDAIRFIEIGPDAAMALPRHAG